MNIAPFFLDLQLQSLEADLSGKIVASPHIVTADQTKALIGQGTEFPYQQAISSGATSVALRKARLKIEVTRGSRPTATSFWTLTSTKTPPGAVTAAGIAIITKHIKTQGLVENGGTIVIGGIFELNESDSDSKVPVLGNIPVLGNLFKSKTRSTSKSELFAFITPKAISGRAAAH